jgi:hypothetical protein
MDLLDAASSVVLPAVRAVFRDGEVSTIRLDIDDLGGGSVSLSLTAKGETFRDLVVQANVDEDSPEAWRERLRSNLVDFVAESRFGWGQNRDLAGS